MPRRFVARNDKLAPTNWSEAEQVPNRQKGWAAYGSVMRPREQRRKLFIRARLKSGDGWDDACIVDLSRRGVGLQAAAAPRRGAYVEIRRGMHVIVARVVWSVGQRFGVAAQDDIPVDFVATDRAPPEQQRQPVGDGERRRIRRRLFERAEASRSWGRRLQFAVIALAGMAAAVVAGAKVHEALAAPLVHIGTALDR